MQLFAPERHRQIIKRLKSEGLVKSLDLADGLQVTLMTIWRDLKHLEEQGLLRRMRGGALAVETLLEPEFKIKEDRSREAKTMIARHVVANYIRSGDILIIDGGTTSAAVVDQILPAKLTILTNSLPIAHKLMRHPSQPTVYLSGGLLRPESGTLVGREALTFFARRRATTLLISATGIDSHAGITDPNPQEIEVKQVMANSAQKIILMADHSKVGVVSLMETLALRRIDKWVTDREVESSFSVSIEVAASAHIPLRKR